MSLELWHSHETHVMYTKQYDGYMSYTMGTKKRLMYTYWVLHDIRLMCHPRMTLYLKEGEAEERHTEKRDVT